MSDTQQSSATLSLNFIAQQICLGNCQFFIGKKLPTNTASRDITNLT